MYSLPELISNVNENESMNRKNSASHMLNGEYHYTFANGPDAICDTGLIKIGAKAKRKIKRNR